MEFSLDSVPKTVPTLKADWDLAGADAALPRCQGNPLLT